MYTPYSPTYTPPQVKLMREKIAEILKASFDRYTHREMVNNTEALVEIN